MGFYSMTRSFTSALFIAAFITAGLVILAIAGVIGLAGLDDLTGVRGPAAARTLVAGRIAGLLALSFVLMQYVLSGRFKCLDRLVGFDRLLIVHRVFAVAAITFACLHPILIYAVPGNNPGSLRWGLWPEGLGAGVLILLVVVVSTSLGRVFLQIPYHVWRRLHLMVFLIAAGAVVHMFKKGHPLQPDWGVVFWAAAVAAYAAIFFRVKIMKPQSLRQHPFIVVDVRPANHNCVQLTLQPPANLTFSHHPGQYAIIRFIDSSLPSEEHPFTISSSGAEPHVRFTMKKCGDFTNRIGEIQSGDLAVLDAPYGRFSYFFHPEPKNLLLIAGGIGITPLLSMLRRLAVLKDQRHITLIWGNRTPEDLFFNDEFKQFSQKLPNFRLFYTFSRGQFPPHHSGHIDKSFLSQTINEQDRAASVFLCGPPEMMNNVTLALKSLKFSRSRIHTEMFSL
jgi:predicted ferric reductase